MWVFVAIYQEYPHARIGAPHNYNERFCIQNGRERGLRRSPAIGTGFIASEFWILSFEAGEARRDRLCAVGIAFTEKPFGEVVRAERRQLVVAQMPHLPQDSERDGRTAAARARTNLDRLRCGTALNLLFDYLAKPLVCRIVTVRDVHPKVDEPFEPVEVVVPNPADRLRAGKAVLQPGVPAVHGKGAATLTKVLHDGMREGVVRKGRQPRCVHVPQGDAME